MKQKKSKNRIANFFPYLIHSKIAKVTRIPNDSKQLVY